MKSIHLCFLQLLTLNTTNNMNQDEQILAMYEAGYSVEEIAEIMCVPIDYVDDLIDNYEEHYDD